MVTDETSEQKPRAPTPEEREAHLKAQMIRDEQTVFGLAVLAMQIHTGTLTKNKNQVANAFLKMGVMLKQNPGFAERFKAAQTAIVAQAQDMARKSIVVPDKRLVTPSGSRTPTLVRADGTNASEPASDTGGSRPDASE